MAKTISDLVREVLQELRVIGDETPSPGDAKLVRERYLSRLETLTKDEYTDWEAEVIPEGAMPGLRRVIAYECATAFAKAIPQTLEVEGLHKLRLYMRLKSTHRRVRAEYF